MGIVSHDIYENIRTRTLVLHRGHILLHPPRTDEGRWGSGAWGLPGGGLEPHESLAECARREVLEETGVAVRVGNVAFLQEWIVPRHAPALGPGDGHGYGYGLEVFHYAYPEEPVPEPRPEKPGDPPARWVPLADVPNLPIWPAALKDLCRRLADGHVPEGDGCPAFVGRIESPWAGTLPDNIAREVDDLARHFGVPAIRTVVVGDDAVWEGRARAREVCMVVRRAGGNLLTFTKDFYPPGVYRLPTGGVEPGEPVPDALLREVHEETGLLVEVRRLLAVVAYRSEDAPDGPPRAYTFAFLLDEVGGALGALDPAERLAAYGEVAPAGLYAIADQLDRLPDAHSDELGESWLSWGSFRAVVHRAVADALRDPGEAKGGRTMKRGI